MEGFLLFILIMIIISAILWAFGIFLKSIGDIKSIYSDSSIRPLDEAFKKVENFNVSQRLISHDYKTAIALNDSMNKLCLLKMKEQTIKSYVLGYQDILECSVIQDGKSVTKVSRSSQIGGTLLGGLLAGPAGAIIGGTTAKSITNSVGNVSLKIILNNQEVPILIISIFVDTNNKDADIINTFNRHKGGDTSGMNSPLDLAHYWHGIVEGLIRRADKEDKNTGSSISIADELAKLSKLRDQKAVDDKEFELFKKRIISPSDSDQNARTFRWHP